MPRTNRTHCIAATLLLLAACQSPSPPPATETPAGTSEAVVDAVFEALGRGDREALDALAAPDFAFHGSQDAGPIPGPPSLAASYAWLLTAFPKLQFEIDQKLTAGETVTVRYHAVAVPQAPVLGQAPVARPVRIEGVDLFTVRGGRISERRSLVDRLQLLQQLTDPHPRVDARHAVPARVLARFEPPAFLESVLTRTDGALWVTSMLEGALYRIDATGAKAPVFRLPSGTARGFRGAMCLTADGDGALMTAITPEAEHHGVWRIDAEGRGTRFAALPPGTAPNGIARLPGGAAVVADSMSARVWIVDAAGTAAIWIEHPLLAPRPYIGRFPGPNGIQVWNGAVYVAPSDRGHIVRIPIAADDRAGVPEIVIPDIGADDFAIADDGTFFITTHPFDKVVRVTPDGTRTEIAGPAEGVVGPTAAALQRNPADKTTLYVVTDGGFYRLPESAPLPPPVQSPAVIALELD